MGAESTEAGSSPRKDIASLAGNRAHVPLCLQQGNALPHRPPRQPELLNELGDAGDRAIGPVVPAFDPCDQDSRELQPHGIRPLVVQLAVRPVSLRDRRLVRG